MLCYAKEHGKKANKRHLDSLLNDDMKHKEQKNYRRHKEHSLPIARCKNGDG
jgi:hypothetical protein